MSRPSGVRALRPGVASDAIDDLARQVQRFDAADHAHALRVVAEALRANRIQRTLACVAERRMPKIMPQCDGLHQILVQAQGPRDGRAICETSSVWVSRVR